MRSLTTADLVPLRAAMKAAAAGREIIHQRLRALRALISSTDTDLATLRADYDAFMEEQVQYNIDFDAWVDSRLAAIETAFGALDQRRPVVMMGTLDQPAKFAEIDSLGGFNLLGTGTVDFSLSSTVTVTKGIGKLIIVVNSGTGLSASFNIAGDSVDRETGAVTAADSELIPMDWGVVSVNNNGTDADGNTTIDLEKCYITSKWYKGTIVISGVTGTKCNISVYHCSFEQFNDSFDSDLDTFDVNVYTTNANAWFYAYLYHVDVLEDTYLCHVSPVTDVSIPSGTAIAGKYWRLRRGELDFNIITPRAGLFINMFHGPSPQEYLQDLEWKVWGKVIDDVPIVIESLPGSPTPPGGGGGDRDPEVEDPSA